MLARNLAEKKAITLLDVWDYYEALEKEKEKVKKIVMYYCNRLRDYDYKYGLLEERLIKQELIKEY